MFEKLPQRPESHQLEEGSERFLLSCLPKNWTAEKPRHDYGVDVRVDINDGSNVTGHELLVQLKSSAHPSAGDTEPVQLRVATFNLLWNKLQVAMLVKYIQEEGEAYYILFKDIPAPKQDQETFTVHIPRANRLSGAPWQEIADHVRTVTDAKLAAMRSNQVSNGFVGIDYIPDEPSQS